MNKKVWHFDCDCIKPIDQGWVKFLKMPIVNIFGFEGGIVYCEQSTLLLKIAMEHP